MSHDVAHEIVKLAQQKHEQEIRDRQAYIKLDIASHSSTNSKKAFIHSYTIQFSHIPKSDDIRLCLAYEHTYIEHENDDYHVDVYEPLLQLMVPKNNRETQQKIFRTVIDLCQRNGSFCMKKLLHDKGLAEMTPFEELPFNLQPRIQCSGMHNSCISCDVRYKESMIKNDEIMNWCLTFMHI